MNKDLSSCSTLKDKLDYLKSLCVSDCDYDHGYLDAIGKVEEILGY